MKAIVLFSGGLDSSLVLKIAKEQGIEVIAVNFVTPFCLCDRKKGCGKQILSKKLGIELKIFNISEEYLKIVKEPRWGYGKNLNPCIDCRILMFKKAKEFMEEIGASFILSGEVLGQRPMSQYKNALKIIDKESGLEGLIVRPLSAKLLPPTIPEQKGWIDREKLFDILGRSRKRQLKLAAEFNLSDYAYPAGGCLLTDPIFSRKIKDLIDSNMLDIPTINLIKYGRYFRINDKFKLIVGRNKIENMKLLSLATRDDLILEPQIIKGPIGVCRGKIKEIKIEDEYIQLAAKIIAFYCKYNKEAPLKIKLKTFLKNTKEEKKEEYVLINEKIGEEELKKYKI